MHLLKKREYHHIHMQIGSYFSFQEAFTMLISFQAIELSVMEWIFLLLLILERNLTCETERLRSSLVHTACLHITHMPLPPETHASCQRKESGFPRQFRLRPAGSIPQCFIIGSCLYFSCSRQGEGLSCQEQRLSSSEHL